MITILPKPQLHRPNPDLSKDENDRLTMGCWVWSLAPWEAFATLTYKWEASQDSVRRTYEKFMRKRLPGVSHFYAIEQNPSRDGHHVHAIWTGMEGIKRKHVWKEWFDAYGRGRIEPVKTQHDVCNYVGKYVTKGNAWWNIELKGSLNPVSKNYQEPNFLLVSGRCLESTEGAGDTMDPQIAQRRSVAPMQANLAFS